MDLTITFIKAKSDQYPVLSDRQYEGRRRREVALLEGYGFDLDVDAEADIQAVEARLYLQSLCRQACLTPEEERCFTLFQSESVETIAISLQMGAKTVRRRIASAIVKLSKVVSASDIYHR